MPLKWTDTEEIAIQLHEAEPELDPLTVRFTDLRDRILALPDFSDDVQRLNEKILEAVQMAWYEEYQDAQG
ncbi:MAG TPA: Fe-S cluster assembly protein IscX [bacterium]|nr:Fe-S cluster assembly protein IscX [bacterium]